MKRTISEEQVWASRFKDQAESGKSIADWRRENNISEGQFYYWRRKLNKKEKAQGAVRWQKLDLTMPEDNSSDQAALEISVEINKAVITVRKGFDESMLLSVLKVVRS